MKKLAATVFVYLCSTSGFVNAQESMDLATWNAALDKIIENGKVCQAWVETTKGGVPPEYEAKVAKICAGVCTRRAEQAKAQNRAPKTQPSNLLTLCNEAFDSLPAKYQSYP